MAHRDEITQLLFQTLNRVRREGVSADIFAEQRKLAQMQFRFKEAQEPMHYVLSLASAMHYYPARDVLRGNYLVEDYDPQLIRHYLTFLVPDNVVITLNAKGQPTKQISPYFAAPYAVASVDQQWLSQWRDSGVNAEITLPEPNRFLPDNFALQSLPDKPLQSAPQLIVEGDRLRLWFKQDHEYRVPKADIYLNIKSSLANQSPRTTALAVMYMELVKDQLREYAYPAMVAGLDFELYKHARGFSLKVRGYTDKQAMLLERILDHLTENPLSVDPGRFDNIKKELIRRWQNAEKRPPYHLLAKATSTLLYKSAWTEPQLIAALERTDSDEVQQVGRQLLRGGAVDMLIHGNYSRAQAGQLAALVESKLPAPTAQVPNTQLHIAKVAPDNSWLKELNLHHRDVALALYVQAPNASLGSEAQMDLTAQILRSQFFHELRTQQQLGYIVSAFSMPMHRLPGLFFVVQSPSHDAAAIEQSIDAFFSAFSQELATLEPSAFLRHQQTLVQRILEKEKNLRAKSDRFWIDIALGYEDFSRREQLAEQVSQLDIASWKAFYRQHVASTLRRGVWVVAYGSKQDEAVKQALRENKSVVTDVSGFKRDQEYYLFNN